MFPLYSFVRLFTELSTEEIKDQAGTMVPLKSMAKLPQTSVEQHFTQYFTWGACVFLSPWSLLVQLLFFKAYLVRGQLHGLWQYLRYLFCTDKSQVSLSHLSLSFLSSGHCFPYASWNLFCFLLCTSYRSAVIHVTWRQGSRKDVYGLFHGHKSWPGFELWIGSGTESSWPALILNQQVCENSLS